MYFNRFLKSSSNDECSNLRNDKVFCHCGISKTASAICITVTFDGSPYD
jgi:hypothetical protein